MTARIKRAASFGKIFLSRVHRGVRRERREQPSKIPLRALCALCGPIIPMTSRLDLTENAEEYLEVVGQTDNSVLEEGDIEVDQEAKALVAEFQIAQQLCFVNLQSLFHRLEF